MAPSSPEHNPSQNPNLLKTIKQSNIITIMITAFASFETARESMQEDAYDYITKPFYVEDIKNKIEAALPGQGLDDQSLSGSGRAGDQDPLGGR